MYYYATVIDVLHILGVTISFCKLWFENDTLIQVRYRHLLGIWYVFVVDMLFSSVFFILHIKYMLIKHMRVQSFKVKS